MERRLENLFVEQSISTCSIPKQVSKHQVIELVCNYAGKYSSVRDNTLWWKYLLKKEWFVGSAKNHFLVHWVCCLHKKPISTSLFSFKTRWLETSYLLSSASKKHDLKQKSMIKSNLFTTNMETIISPFRFPHFHNLPLHYVKR